MSKSDYIQYADNEENMEMLLASDGSGNERRVTFGDKDRNEAAPGRQRVMTAGASQRRDDVVAPKSLSRYDTVKGEDKALTKHKFLGMSYYNNIMFHVPFLNAIWPAVDDNADPPAFSQITDLLNTIILAAALALAFVLTIHSAVGFSDLSAEEFGGGGGFPSVVNKNGANWRFGKTNGTCNTNYCVYWTVQRQQENSPVVLFNWNCIVAEVLLTLCLLKSVLIMGTGVTNVFCRDNENAGFQSRVVMQAYMKWIRWPILACIIELVLGAIVFFWGLEKMVYIKIPDHCVEQTGRSYRGPDECPYQTVRDAVQYGIIVPFLIAFIFVSFGTHRAYMYPIRPDSDSKVYKTDRKAHREMMSHFLKLHCGLPDNPGSIFLSAAGGIPSSEVEVISDSLFDFGIISINELLEFVTLDDGSMLGEIPGINLCARMKVITGCAKYMEELNTASFMGRQPPQDSDKMERYQTERAMWLDAVGELKKLLLSKFEPMGIDLSANQLEGLCNLLVDSELTTDVHIRAFVASGMTSEFKDKGLSLGTIISLHAGFSK